MKSIGYCIRFFGNLFAQDEAACSHYVQDCQILDLVKRSFTYCTKVTRKEALWLVSNIAANGEVEANILADSTIVMNLLTSCHDSTLLMRKEAIWALTNILHKVSGRERIENLVNMDIISTIIDLMQKDVDNGPIATLALAAVDLLLSKSESAKMAFIRRGGQEVLEDMQLSQFYEVYKQASDILEIHLGATEMGALEKMEFINSKKDAFNI